MIQQNLKYFIGKVCSIFTVPISRNFKEENPATFPQQPYLYFVGLIEAVDEKGMLVTQVMTGLKSYFFLTGLVAIAEEEVLIEDNAEDAKIIDQLKTSQATIKEKYVSKKPEFVNPELLKSMLND